MTSPSVTHGTFSDYRRVKTRSVVQVTIEIPMERWDDALKALGGSPMPGKEPWVAVALLKEEPRVEARELPAGSGEPVARQADLRAAGNAVMRSMVGKERYANADEQQKAVVRAALLCKDAAFQKWLGVEDEESASVVMREIIGTSRKTIGTESRAFHLFLDLENQFRAAQQIEGFSPHLTGQRS